jgi:hypothetical protein
MFGADITLWHAPNTSGVDLSIILTYKHLTTQLLITTTDYTYWPQLQATIIQLQITTTYQNYNYWTPQSITTTTQLLTTTTPLLTIKLWTTQLLTTTTDYNHTTTDYNHTTTDHNHTTTDQNYYPQILTTATKRVTKTTEPHIYLSKRVTKTTGPHTYLSKQVTKTTEPHIYLSKRVTKTTDHYWPQLLTNYWPRPKKETPQLMNHPTTYLNYW